MGNCITDKSLQKRKKQRLIDNLNLTNHKNPIVKAIRTKNAQLIYQRWQDNESQVLTYKLSKDQKFIEFSQFLKILPGLKKCFSQVIQNRIYQLFNFQQHSQVNKEDFIITQLILLRSDDYQLLADILFYIYSSDPDKKIINNADYHFFQKQMKQMKLDFKDSTRKVTANQKGQILIEKQQFRQIFEQLDIKSIRQLFRFSMKQQQMKFQRKLAKQGINLRSGQPAYLIQISWFLKWRGYLQYKWAIKILLTQNSKPLTSDKQQMMSTLLGSNQKILHASKFLAKQTEITIQPINNMVIKGQEMNQLREGLGEYVEFVAVPEDVWKLIRICYGGGPTIKKVYPKFYTKKLLLTVIFPEKVRFGYRNVRLIDYNENTTFEDLVQHKLTIFKPQQCPNLVVYYKYPGKTEWSKIQNLQSLICSAPFLFRTYILFLKKKLTPQFQQTFNLTSSKGNSLIKQRIKNFASILNFQNQGVLEQGHVGNISRSSVTIYFKNQRGLYQKIQKSIACLEKDNPPDESQLQAFAGLENCGNSCYINATMQCLLRTPYFTNFLDQFQFTQSDSKLLIHKIFDLYNKGKKSRDCLEMTDFKRTLDQIFPFFEGSAQHDAQQFLTLLLDKLSQQKAQKSKDLNSKIKRFFSGYTECRIKCVKCNNISKVNQTFFSYSLSLPIISQVSIPFIFIDKSFTSYKHILTIAKTTQLQQFQQKISMHLQIKRNQLIIMNVFNGQWIQSLEKKYRNRLMVEFDHADMQMVCYGVDRNDQPEYHDFKQNNTHTSVKIQIRNRIYDGKAQQFTAFFYPFSVQITQKTKGKQLKDQIVRKMKNFINQQQLQAYQQAYQKKSDTKQQGQEDTQHFNYSPDNQQQKTPQGQDDFDAYVFRYVKLQSTSQDICWFCRKQINDSEFENNKSKYCQGCSFQNDDTIYQVKKFRNSWKTLAIMIDWRSQTLTKNFKVQQTKSCQQALKQEQRRRSRLEQLLKESHRQQQEIQSRCQKPWCGSVSALRSQLILTPPNILILHLKRFQFNQNKFFKLRNQVLVPQQINLPGSNQPYQLYGNVVHFGSGRGGHYVNWVKHKDRWYYCDDQKVRQLKNDNNDYLNKDAYVLFYKRKNIQETLKVFGD